LVTPKWKRLLVEKSRGNQGRQSCLPRPSKNRLSGDVGELSWRSACGCLKVDCASLDRRAENPPATRRLFCASVADPAGGGSGGRHLQDARLSSSAPRQPLPPTWARSARKATPIVAARIAIVLRRFALSSPGSQLAGRRWQPPDFAVSRNKLAPNGGRTAGERWCRIGGGATRIRRGFADLKLFRARFHVRRRWSSSSHRGAPRRVY
jgi:hypothetical protein